MTGRASCRRCRGWPRLASKGTCWATAASRAMGWMAPYWHGCATVGLSEITLEEPCAMQIATIGLDLAKHVFQVHGVDAAGKAVLRRRLRRVQVVDFFAALSPCLV